MTSGLADLHAAPFTEWMDERLGDKGNTHMKSLATRWEPLAMDLNSTPSKLMS